MLLILELNGNKKIYNFINFWLCSTSELVLTNFIYLRCHGEKNNVVYEMVNKHNVLEGATINYPTCNFLKSTGELVNDDLCARLMHLCFEILENCKDELKNFKGSLGNYIVAKYQEAIRSSDYKDIDIDTANQLLEYFHKFENSIESSDTWFETSGNGYLHYWECEGNPLLAWKNKGYRTVLDFLMVIENILKLSSVFKFLFCF